MLSAAATQPTLEPLDLFCVIDFVTCVDEGLIEANAANWRVFDAVYVVGAQPLMRWRIGMNGAKTVMERARAKWNR